MSIDRLKYVNRRTALKRIGVATAGIAVGFGADRVAVNESLIQGKTYDSDVLFSLAQASGKDKQFGMYPDRETEGVNPFDQMNEARDSVQKLDLVGSFGNLEDFQNPFLVEKHLKWLRDVHEWGAEPVFSLGVGTSFNRHHPLSNHNFAQMEELIQIAAHKLSALEFPKKIAYCLK